MGSGLRRRSGWPFVQVSCLVGWLHFSEPDSRSEEGIKSTQFPRGQDRYEAMPLQTIAKCKHLLRTNARPEAFAAHSRPILARLGYAILTPREFEVLAEESVAEQRVDSRVEMLIVDEHRMEEVAGLDPSDELPIVLLTGRRGIRDESSRIVAAVKRPAGLHDLYRVLQQFFEEHPRTAPRVSTHLRAQCRRKGHDWSAAVVSLSENGCLMRSPEPVPLGSMLNMRLQLPRVGSIEIEAETAYQLVPDLGLVFSSVPVHVREAIGEYVHDALAPAWVMPEQQVSFN